MHVYDEQVSRRFAAVEARVMSLEEKIDKQSASIDMLVEKLTKVSSSVADLETATPEEVAEASGFDRPVDHSLLRINVPSPVAKTEVLKVLQGLLAEASVGLDQAELLGEDSGKLFSLALTGDKALAAKRVAKVQQLLRPKAAGGEWRKLVVRGADGDYPLYLGPDKNAKQIQQERHAKLLARIIKSKVDIPIEHNRREGVLTTGWVPLAKVSAVSRGVSQVQWNLLCVGEKCIPRDVVLAEFTKAAAEPGGFRDWA
jgi:hypothetical protein